MEGEESLLYDLTESSGGSRNLSSAVLSSFSLSDNSTVAMPNPFSAQEKAPVTTPSPTSGSAGPTLDIHMLKLIVLSVMFILILCGNAFVLVALSGRKLRKNRMYFFLYHLSIADLITGFGNVLPQLAWEAHGHFIGGNALCKFIKYLQILGPYLSSYVLVMTAIDRYQAICHPLSNSGASNTGSRTKKMVGVAWTIALLSCAPQVLIFSYKQAHPNDAHYECWATFPTPWSTTLYVTWYAISIFFVPFVILTYTHVLICREIWFSCASKRASFLVQRKSATTKQFSPKACPNDCISACPSENPSESLTRMLDGNNNKPTNGHYRSATLRKQLLNDTPSDNSLQKWFLQQLSRLTNRHKRSETLETTACRNECCLVNATPTNERPLRGGSDVHLCINPLPLQTSVCEPSSECCMRNCKSDSDINESPSRKSCSSRAGSLKCHTLEQSSARSIKHSAVGRPGKPVVPTHRSTARVPCPASSSATQQWISRPERSSSEGSAEPGAIQPVVPRMHRIKSGPAGVTNPRVHSMHGLTRAKIKTVKVTLVVISCYVACSSPFICVQLWSVYWPGAHQTPFWNGTVIAILMLLASLNSCVNPWIYLYFNPNLASSFFGRFFRQGQTRRSNSDANINSAANQPAQVNRSTAAKKAIVRPNGSTLSNERKFSPAFGQEVMPLQAPDSRQPAGSDVKTTAAQQVRRKITMPLLDAAESTSNMEPDGDSRECFAGRPPCPSQSSRSRRISVQLERAWSRLVQHPV